MKVLVITLICLTILGLSHGRSVGPLRVANGSIEEPHSSPWQVKLYLGVGLTFWPCGGTLISQNYVLTAARCFTYQNTLRTHGIYVYIGVWDVQHSSESGSLYLETNVNHVTYHEGYNATTHEHDIALIKLPETIELSDKIQPAQLLAEDAVKIGQVSHISGWQYPMREWDPSHQYLHGGEVTIVGNSVCQEEYPAYVINENVVCASGSVAMCYGDEGAALPINGTVAGMAFGSKDVLVPGEECPIVPNTYLYIPKYLDWIKANSDYTD